MKVVVKWTGGCSERDEFASQLAIVNVHMHQLTAREADAYQQLKACIELAEQSQMDVSQVDTRGLSAVGSRMVGRRGGSAAVMPSSSSANLCIPRTRRIERMDERNKPDRPRTRDVKAGHPSVAGIMRESPPALKVRTDQRTHSSDLVNRGRWTGETR